MEAENKLDKDFLFYLNFINNAFHSLRDDLDKHRSYAWLKKLCCEPCKTVERKRDRNVYLSNLVLQMQSGRLEEPFTRPPRTVDIANALNVFVSGPEDVNEPEWLKEVVDGSPVDKEEETSERNARTYLATRTLPKGAGAFAYIAVTLAEQEPKWLGGGEGMFDKRMEEEFRMRVPPVTEMEKILARRKDPRERERVLAFYDMLLQNIAGELDGTIEPNQNETINTFLTQLIDDLKKKDAYAALEQMDENSRRVELLLRLHERIVARRNKTAKREEVLDQIEEKVLPSSFFDTSVEVQDKFLLPAAMWEQVINRPPAKRNMDLLQENYPLSLIEKFLELMSNYKEEVAVRIQKRHENIISQAKKDFRLDLQVDKQKLEDLRVACQKAEEALADVKFARARQIEIERRNQERRTIPLSEHSKIYEQMRGAIIDTQRSVEEEARIGKQLAANINVLNEQMEAYMQVNEEVVRQTEQVNMDIMKNIKRLRGAIQQNEARLMTLQTMTKHAAQGAAGQQQLFLF